MPARSTAPLAWLVADVLAADVEVADDPDVADDQAEDEESSLCAALR